MACHSIRTALFISAILAVAVSPVRADDAPKTTAPKTRTITVTECVPETYTEKRTVNKWECRKVEVQSFRCETVCVPKERQVTVTKRVPVMNTETRQVCVNETSWECKTVMKKSWEYKQVTSTEK